MPLTLFPQRGSTILGIQTYSRHNSTKPFRSSRKSINYANLNDGLDPFRPPSLKRQKRTSYRPRKDGPSECRLTAHTSGDKETRSLDLENIMDTTLDDDNDVPEGNLNTSEIANNAPATQHQSEITGVTGMDGVTPELPDPESESTTQHVTPLALNNKMDGVTIDTSHSNDVNTKHVTLLESAESAASLELPSELNAKTPMDGVTKIMGEPPTPPLQQGNPVLSQYLSQN